MADSSTYHRKRDMLRQLSEAQLLDLLRQDALGGSLSADGADAALIMAVLEERARAGEDCRLSDVSQALQDFQTKYNTPEGEGLCLFPPAEAPWGAKTPGRPRGKSRRLRRGLAAAATAAVLLAVIIPAALGRDRLETAGLEAEESAQTEASTEELPEVLQPVEAHFDSVQAAFDACGITGVQAPQWVPEGYEYLDTIAYFHESGRNLTAAYCADEEYLMVTVNIDTISTPQFVKDENPVEEFYSNGVRHYLFTNNSRHVVVWQYEDTVFSITGCVGPDDLKKMADSMFP